MITLTKEQLISSAHARIEFAEMMLAGELEPLKERTWSIELELAGIALASLEAEAVFEVEVSGNHWLNAGPVDDSDFSGMPDGVNQLYSAPPAPVAMKDHQIRELVNELRDIAVKYHGSQQLREHIARSIRAAMLQGADEKPELTVWYGSMPETNGKTNWTAMLHRKVQHPWEGITIECSEYPDRVRYEADRMRHLIGELSEEPDILEYDADAHSGYVKLGNSPVIPDGWVACSERMPETMVSVLVTGTWFHHAVAFWDGLSWCDLDFEQPVTHWMPLPAAPQQEAKNV